MASNHPAAPSGASPVATHRNKNNHEWPVQAPAPTKPYISRQNTGRSDVSDVSTLYYTEDEIKVMGYRPFEYWTPPKTSRNRPPSSSATSRSRSTSRSVSRPATTSRRNSSKAPSLATVVDVESQLDEEDDVYHRLEVDHKLEVDHTIDVDRTLKLDLHPKLEAELDDDDDDDDFVKPAAVVARPPEIKVIGAAQRFYLGDREPPPSSPRVKDRVKARKAAERRARRERRQKRASLGEWLGWQPDSKAVARLRRGEGLFVEKERWRNPRTWRRRTWGVIAAVLLSMLVLGLIFATTLVKDSQHTALEEFVLGHPLRA